MTATKTQFNPYTLNVRVTGDYNFFYVESKTIRGNWYGVLLTGPGAALCSCEAAFHGRGCCHRAAVLARYAYVTPIEDDWAGILDRAETQMELDAYRAMELEAA